MTQLENKVAIVTGGASGIGLATGQRFAREGAKVLLVDINEAGLNAAVTTIGADKTSYFVADVSHAETAQAYVTAAIERYGQIDIFVANAGIEGDILPIPDYSIDAFDQVMGVNVRGVWLGLKYVIPKMADSGGGSIIITSSQLGVRGAKDISGYVTSKYALIGLMKCAALECADLNIRVNTINPGPIETPMSRVFEEKIPGDPDAIKREIASGVPLKRYGEPEEVANLMVFLASDASSYCTGGVYMVDGGDSI